MRLIDADALILNTIFNPNHVPFISRQDVQEAPTVETKRGRWIKSETSEAFDIAGVKTWALKAKCSNCGFVHKFIEAHMCYGYCPQCGAMVGGGDTDEEAKE